MLKGEQGRVVVKLNPAEWEFVSVDGGFQIPAQRLGQSLVIERLLLVAITGVDQRKTVLARSCIDAVPEPVGITAPIRFQSVSIHLVRESLGGLQCAFVDGTRLLGVG